jgi:hypothetical protein
MSWPSPGTMEQIAARTSPDSDMWQKKGRSIW